MSPQSSTPPPAPAPAATTASGPPFHTARCPVCDGRRVHYSFSSHDARILQCPDCDFTFRADAPPPGGDGATMAETLLARFGGAADILAQVLPEADAPRIAYWRPDGSVSVPAGPGPVLTVGQLDDNARPLPGLVALRDQLSAGDTVVFIHADVRHLGAEVGSDEWERSVGRRNAYVDTPAALTILFRAGFRCRGVQRLRRRVTLDELLRNPHGDLVVSPWRRRLLRLIPAALRRAVRAVVDTDLVAIVASPRPADAPALSVVVPVYNERAFVARLLDAVLRVEFPGAPVEVVVVESNSTDGSREIVQGFATHPRVTCILEDRPRGKGHATRLGLARARGDIVLIQDADLEYDIEDYHSLVEPILRGHQAFMLGSRHGGRRHWKLRQFGKPLTSKFYNLAHVLVTGYINLLFGLRLRDPQTMFKVCRRDCLEGLVFNANYFNFDYELLLKVVRRGYLPAEVPVNYRSRSHAEGKKIRMWRDAPLGLWMITKLRFTPLRRFLTTGGRIE